MPKTLSKIQSTVIYSSILFSVISIGFLTSSTAKNFPININNMPPKIQLAILLDTSSSMDGLIDQTRNQLWQVVNEFSTAKRNGVVPILEVAVYEYGNDQLSSHNGYTRLVTPLTTELDAVSEALFSLKTNGGQEYCGYAIDKAIKQLQWSTNHNDIKAIFIAGNEAFTQGPTPYQQAIALAKDRGITVNTIHAGDYETGIKGGWQNGALLASGNYMSIDHNHQIAHITAPQDKEIAQLNEALNSTYIPYGANGNQNLSRQRSQDDKSSGISLGLLSQRIKAKISSAYNNSKWDLVDAFESEELDLENIDANDLPEPMQTMNIKEQLAFVQEQANRRNDIHSQIASLNMQRDRYIKEEKQKTANDQANTMVDALVAAIRQQGEKKQFSFKAE